MRLAVALFVLICACGTEPSRPDTAPDAAVGNTPDASTGSGTPLTVCQQATQHSDLTWIQDNVFTSTCALAHCHAEDNQAGGLVLASGMSHGYLVNRPSTVQTTMMRVLPGDPANSYLLIALGGEPGNPPEGSVMPWGGAAPLCAEEIDAIKRWVAAGANP
jgi:hypothetical protein